jgi:tetratricopeptide (TPR) repeat protein
VNSEHEAALARAEGLIAIERWQEALTALSPALGSDDTAADAHCLASQCHLGLHQWKEAKAEAERALAFFPDHPWPHRLLAIAYLQGGSVREAGKHAAEAVRLEPNSASSLHVLVLAQLADKRTVAAEQAATASLAANEHEPMAHLSMAMVKEAQRDWPAAEAAYREGLRIEPDDPQLTLGLARTLHRQGRKRREEAGDAYLAAARANPTGKAARHGLSRLGLPIFGVGLIIKLFLIGGLQASLHLDNPLEVAGLLGGIAVLLGGGLTLLRVRGTRHLPESVRSGLLLDHRNYALGWLALAGVVAAGTGIWAAFVSSDNGGGPLVAAALLAAGAVALFFARRSPAVSLRTPARWGRGYAFMFRRFFR